MSRHSYVPLLALLALTACGVGGTDDADSDGVTVAQGDCDDADPTVKPGAEDRTVDGLDQDCDGIDGPDEDGDGFVDAAAGGDDCDDGDAAIFPDAAEIWDDGIDQDCDGLADVEDAECSADLTLTLPDGTEVAVDGCTVWAVEMGVDFDPDEAPSISELWLTLDGVTGEGADCSLTIHQEGVCGAGFYDFRDEAASWVTMNTNDCPGVAGSDEGEFGATSGYLHVETIETDDLEMTQSGDPLDLAMAGYVTATNTNQLSMSGAFAFSLTAPTTDVDGAPFCVVEDGDADDDAYTDPYFGGDDCEAENASVNPGATEDCSTVRDDNCDGELDEEGALECTTFYIDLDGDGHGDASASACWCSTSGDYTATNDTDCDDSDAAISPSEGEVCDGVDNDCSGAADEGFVVYYADTDGDGYGDASTAVCYARSGYVTDATDCDDADGRVNPGEVELCEDGIDNDCDGAGCGLGSRNLSTAIQYTGESAYNYAGVVSGAGDVDGDGYDDMLVGAQANDDGGLYSGAAYLLLGSAAPASASLSTAIQYTGEAASDSAGVSVSGAGDVNGDGYDDMLVGAPYNDDSGSDAGAAYLLLGSAAPASASLSSAIQYSGERASDGAGWSVSSAGDVNGDGYDDMLVGAPYNDDAGTDGGVAYLLLGSAAPASASLSTALQYTGEAASDDAGAVSGAGDVDGDGYGDMLVGARGNDDGGYYAGAAYLLLGTAAPASARLSTAIEYTGEEAGDYAGGSVSSAGDVNGDGYDDMLVGAFGNGDGSYSSGAAYLLLGSAAPASASLSAATKYTGEAASDSAGVSVSSAGDVDGDGYDDMLVGALSGGGAGAAYLLLGSAAPASVSLSTAYQYSGEGGYDFAGYVSGAGDVDSDGYDDMLVGASYNGDGGFYAGAAYLLFGATVSTGL